MTWLKDANGNKCSVEYFGSKEAAQKALDSLLDCENCTNCSDCSGCSRCSDFERVMPKADDMIFSIGLDARKLKALMDQFETFCNETNKNGPASVVFSFQSESQACQMTCTRDEQTMTALLMPVRDIATSSNAKFNRMQKTDRLMREYQDSTDERREEILVQVADLTAK